MFKENKLVTTFRLFKRAFWNYKYRVVALILAGFVGAFAEAIGVNAIIPLFSFIVQGQSTPNDIISKYIISLFGFLHIPYSLKFMLVFIAVLFILKALMTFATNFATDKIRTDYIRNTRQNLLSLAFHTEWLYLSKQRIGYLEKILMNDINVYSSLLTYASSLVIFSLNAFMYIFIAFNISPIVTLITVAMGGIFLLSFKPLMDKVRVSSLETANTQKIVANHINESILGMKTIKAMALEERLLARGREIFDVLRKNEMRLSVIASMAYVLTQPLSIFVILILFSYSYKLTSFSLASFAVVVYAINRIFTYVQQGQAQLHNLNSLYPFLRSVIDFEEQARKHLVRPHGHKEFTFNTSITFDNVSFSYDSHSKVLKNISLEIEKGQTVAVIGPSGGGKTTFVDSLLNLIKPQEGKILVDGKDLEDINSESWKKHIGYVSQENFLINDTIRNNIAFFDPTISEADIIEAAKKAHIYDFIKSRPLGLDAPVGERGLELSGGQRQRIALARVLARKVSILILDEATSALDNESEAAIQKAIEELHGKVTIVIIAHRPTTVANADNLFVIKDGTIIETGKPSYLLAQEDSYYHKVFYAKH